jgi:hypothetical protein
VTEECPAPWPHTTTEHVNQHFAWARAQSEGQSTTPTIRVEEPFGSGEIPFTEAAVRQLLTWAVAIADDHRRWSEDPLNDDWVEDAKSLAGVIQFQTATGGLQP